MSNTFYIQWHDGKDNKSGSFKGRTSTRDSWSDLDGFSFNESSSYDFYFSLSSGITYSTYVSFREDDGPQVGVYIPAGTTDANPIHIGPLSLGTKHVTLEAAVLSGSDPKVQVGWGSGDSITTVSLTWDGSSWSISNATSLGDNTWSATSTTSVKFKVTDSSKNQQFAVVGQIVDANSAVILPGVNLATAGSHDHTFQEDMPSGASSTEYSVNLYNPMSSSCQVSVN